MLKRHALVRHLIAAETLGSVSVICTDKTGTLTKGHMQVARIVTPKHDLIADDLEKPSEELQNIKEINEILTACILNNDAQTQDSKKIIGHPTEIALLQAATDAKVDIEQIREKYKRIDEIPFSSAIKYMATIHQFDDHTKLIVKGAPEKIFEMCMQNPSTSSGRTGILEKFKKLSEQMAKEGLRILAVAQKDAKQIDFKKDLVDLNLLGLIGIQDPLRPEAQATVKELKKAGIKVVLVTGDHKDTAANIAKSTGIIPKEKGIVTGTELDKMDEKQLVHQIKDIDVFARVDPRHKIRIVDAWQAKGNPVAMIGDGVNDAPALKAADIGVALGSGSDVAHEISDMVLLDNNLSTIDAAVKEGRAIFDNIRKVITYLLSDCFGEIILITLAIIFNYPLPILAPQILWINLISDGFPYIALTMEPPEPEIMTEPPRPKNEPILNKEIKTIIFNVGILTDLILFPLYIFLLKSLLDISHVRTIMFTTLAINSLFFVFPIKSFRKSIFQINLLSNSWLFVAVIFSLLAQIAVIYVPLIQKLFNTIPLSLYDWGIVVIFSLTKTIAIEITKKYFLLKK
jgi:Ca2+-transporting ATPase